MATNETNQNASLDTEKVGAIGRDTGMDLSSLLKEAKDAPDEKPKTPLQQMKEAKEKNGLGLVVNNDELVNEGDKKLITNKSEDDAIKDVDSYIAEQDKLIDAAQKVKINQPLRDARDMVAVMDSLENYANGQGISSEENGKTMLRERSEGDTQEASIANEEAHVEVPEETISEEKKELVEVLIDKTGLGGDFAFTPEEREKIFNATEIKVKEVEEVSLSSIRVKKCQKSFIDHVNDYQLSSSRVPIVFPASRFRAEMTGLSYGEMGDISLNTENLTFDQIHKKLSVIYNKMVNPSCGKFENFEDFLRKFAYIDIDLAVYGLIVASFPEVDDIPLTCNNPKCKNGFNHKFSPRTLIKFNKCGNKFLEAMRDIVECKAVDYEKLFEDSPTRTHVRYKLPLSGFIVEVGIASSYDYLYSIVDNVLGDKFNTDHPDDVNGILQLNTTMLSLIRAIYVPDGDEYIEYTEFEDVIQALYHIKPEEIQILSSLLQKVNDNYSTAYELTDIVCPHCGQKTTRIPIDINSLVFLKYQRLMSTSLDISNITVL